MDIGVTYQNAFNASSSSSEGAYDRARGGKIEIKLTIPSQTYDLSGPCGGSVKSPEMKLTMVIDVEELPLVNVAGYSIEEEQIGPDTMDHPDAIKLEGTFG